MKTHSAGIHHITAIAGDPQANLDFYAGTLGLRLVKKTVNFDDPTTYHFYFGDRFGRPGTILTFFPAGYPAPRGKPGSGQVTAVAFSAPAGAREFWTGRLRDEKVVVDQPGRRFDTDMIAFRDPDGLKLEIIFSDDGAESSDDGGPLPGEYAIRGFHSATITVRDVAATAELLTGTLGFSFSTEQNGRQLFKADGEGCGKMVELEQIPQATWGRIGPGAVHHIAWRTASDDTQNVLLGELTRMGFYVSPVTDRLYFHSIYFREPGGVLFEVATDPPGFTVDEKAGELGGRLTLPPSLENRREALERVLPPVSFPVQGKTGR